jgi:hypothetical protein
MNRPLIARVAAVAWLASLGCDDAAAPVGENSIQVRAFARSASQPGTPSGDIVELDVDQVLLVLGRVKLETAGVDGTVDFTDEHSVVVPLRLNGSGVLAVDADPPAGTYKELEIAIDKLELGHLDEHALIQQYPSLSNASIVVEGTVTLANGSVERFVFAHDADIDLELPFAPDLTVTHSDERVTLVSLVLDLTGWFRGATGAVLDPRDPANRSVIAANLQHAIEVFEDPDRDGR